MAVNMVTLPEPESGTKCPKLTTPKYGAFAMVLSAEQYKLWLSFKTIAIDTPGGNLNFVRNIKAQTTALNRNIFENI